MVPDHRPLAIEPLDRFVQSCGYRHPCSPLLDQGFRLTAAPSGTLHCRSEARDLPGVSRRRLGTLALYGEHVKGYGRGPGLLVGAERLAGKRLEVLSEAAFGELREGFAAYLRGAARLAGAD